MTNRKREIFIKFGNLKEIIEVLESIKEKEAKLNSNFKEYDALNEEENKIFENWESYLEEINQKLNHIAL